MNNNNNTTNKFVILVVAALAALALVCGTALILHHDLEAQTAWPGLLTAVIVPVIFAMLGVRQEGIGSAVSRVEEKVNGRTSELQAMLARAIELLSERGQSTEHLLPEHPEDREAVVKSLHKRAADVKITAPRGASITGLADPQDPGPTD